MMNVYERELQAPYLIYGVCDLNKGGGFVDDETWYLYLMQRRRGGID